MSIEVYPVVHINDPLAAVEQSGIAFELGADGVYLIDHKSRNSNVLFQAFNEVEQEYPEKFIGVNILAYPFAASCLRVIKAVKERDSIDRVPNALWFDDVTLDMGLAKLSKDDDPVISSVRLLGGVAFKYTDTYTDDPEIASQEAKRLVSYVDVVTTSGSATGSPPSIQKIAKMKAAIGNQGLAIASGISVENIADYRGIVDQVLVSTSVETEKYSGIFDPARLADLIASAHCD